MSLSFDLSETQTQFAQSLERFLARHCGAAGRATDRAAGAGDQRLWRLAYEELDLPALMVPETHGGHAGAATEAGIVMEALGRHLGFDAFAEHGIVAPLLLQRLGADALLSEIAKGRARVALGFAAAGWAASAPLPLARAQGGGVCIEGSVALVVGGAQASHLLLCAAFDDAPALFLIATDDPVVARTDYILVDGRSASDFAFQKLEAPMSIARGETAERALQRARADGVAAACAEALGVLREMLAITIDYLNARRQFGAPLASFQAIQHRIAEMALAIEKTEVMNVRLRHAMGEQGNDALVAAAKVVASEALRFVGQSAVQLHGAMGTVEEALISHYFRRATVLESKFGASPANLDRYTTLFAQTEDGRS